MSCPICGGSVAQTTVGYAGEDRNLMYCTACGHELGRVCDQPGYVPPPDLGVLLAAASDAANTHMLERRERAVERQLAAGALLSGMEWVMQEGQPLAWTLRVGGKDVWRGEFLNNTEERSIRWQEEDLG